MTASINPYHACTYRQCENACENDSSISHLNAKKLMSLIAFRFTNQVSYTLSLLKHLRFFHICIVNETTSHQAVYVNKISPWTSLIIYSTEHWASVYYMLQMSERLPTFSGDCSWRIRHFSRGRSRRMLWSRCSKRGC